MNQDNEDRREQAKAGLAVVKGGGLAGNLDAFPQMVLDLLGENEALTNQRDEAKNTVDRLALILGFSDSTSVSIDAATLMVDYKRLKGVVDKL